MWPDAVRVERGVHLRVESPWQGLRWRDDGWGDPRWIITAVADHRHWCARWSRWTVPGEVYHPFNQRGSQRRCDAVSGQLCEVES